MFPRDTFNKLDEAKKSKILDAAVDEFSRHGFRQASVNRMVEQIGIAKGSLFQYFGSKEGLFQRYLQLCGGACKAIAAAGKKRDFQRGFFRANKREHAGGNPLHRAPPQGLSNLPQDDFPGRLPSSDGVFAAGTPFFSGVPASRSRGRDREGGPQGRHRHRNGRFHAGRSDGPVPPGLLRSVSRCGGRHIRGARDELERKVDEFIKLLRIGMGASLSVETGPGESAGQKYVRTTVF